MAHTEVLDAYPKDLGHIDKRKLAECIAACFECAQVCTACADAWLSEDMVAELTKCLRTEPGLRRYLPGHRQRAVSAHRVRRVRDPRVSGGLCDCKACGNECESQADMHEHCPICARACRRCEEARRALLAAWAGEPVWAAPTLFRWWQPVWQPM